jgi:hypothetical protein
MQQGEGEKDLHEAVGVHAVYFAAGGDHAGEEGHEGEENDGGLHLCLV